jgi:hypothetical protein
MKQLQGDVDKLQDSEAMKKARAAYERARVCVSGFGCISLTIINADICVVDLGHQRKSTAEGSS